MFVVLTGKTSSVIESTSWFSEDNLSVIVAIRFVPFVIVEDKDDFGFLCNGKEAHPVPFLLLDGECRELLIPGQSG